MRIDQNVVRKVREVSYSNQKNIKKVSPNKRGDEIKISNQAIDLNDLKNNVTNIDNMERVEKLSVLKEQIQKGTYKVPAHLVAKKMLAFLEDR